MNYQEVDEPSRTRFSRWSMWTTTGSSENGATAVEYALILAFIAGVVITTVTILGQQVKGLWEIQWW